MVPEENAARSCKHPDRAAVIHMRRPSRRAKPTGATSQRRRTAALTGFGAGGATQGAGAGRANASARGSSSAISSRSISGAPSASPISYLRDAHDADEAVQDAFVKVFTHITTYREDIPFEVWFTRILVNGCLDLRKARARRLRWALPMSSPLESAPNDPPAVQPSPEDRVHLDRAGRPDR